MELNVYTAHVVLQLKTTARCVSVSVHRRAHWRGLILNHRTWCLNNLLTAAVTTPHNKQASAPFCT